MGVVFQPEFDKRMLTIGNNTKGIRRGQMWRDPQSYGTAKTNNVASLDRVQWGYQFLYNPSTLTLSYNMDGTLYPPGALPGDNASGNGSGTAGAGTSDNNLNLLGPGSSVLGFDLILDRTYECWGGPPTNKTQKIRNGLDIDHRRGVMVDFEHFNAMMGYTEENPFVISQPLFLSFGNKKGNFYYGYVTGYQFGVSNWTQYMIPNRGGIAGIQFQILPLPASIKKDKLAGGAAQGFKQGLSRQPNAVTSDVLTSDTAPANPAPTPDPVAAGAATAAPTPTPTPTHSPGV